jgi:hypothetical protein
MAPVVRIEPNGSQTLLLFDNARKDLENSGWLVFIQRFEGFNLSVAQQFSLTFDGFRAKVGDIQLELNEEFISSATGLKLQGKGGLKTPKSTRCRGHYYLYHERLFPVIKVCLFPPSNPGGTIFW